MNTLDSTHEKGFFSLFKGASGCGKSVAALSFPGLYVFDYDHKMPAIAKKHFPKKEIHWDTFADAEPISDLITSWLVCPRCGKDRLCEKQGGVCGTSCPYETLSHDSLTNMENLVLRTVGEAKGESVPQMIKTMMKTRGGKGKTEMMDFDYYKAEMRFTEWLLWVSKVLWAREGNPKHILFTAHVMTTEQNNILTGLVTKTRSIVSQGKAVGAFIPTQFDEVYLFGYQEAGGMGGEESKIKYLAKTRPYGEDDAKTAYKLQDTIDFTNGNFYDLLQKMIAGQKFIDGIV